MTHFALLGLSYSVYSATEFGGMVNGTHHGMMYGTTSHGMGWGWMLVCMLFALLILAVLVLTIMALLKYLRKPE